MRANILLLLAATLVMAARASAVTITRGPIIENPDAVTSMITIAWWTDTAGDSTVDYGVNSAALLFSNTVPQAGSCEIGAAGTCHIVTLSGLLPGTRYYYRLKVGGVIVQNTGSSGPYFTTLKDPTDTTDLFFTIIGDWGQASGHEQSVSNLQDAADPQMIVTVGDNAYQNGAQSDWDNNALAYYVNPMKRVTFFPTLGNHDLNSVGASSWASSVEIKMFALPRTSQTVVDAIIPGGAYYYATRTGWKVNRSQTTWTYRNGLGGIQGLVKVTVKRSVSSPGIVSFATNGRNGTYPVAPNGLPLAATFVVDSPTAQTGQCGEATFPGSPGPACHLNGLGNTITCK